MIFHTQSGILGKYSCVSHTLFILYLEGNLTLFGEKLYFIWKFSSGNTALRYIPFLTSIKLKHGFAYKYCVDISWVDQYQICRNRGATPINGIIGNFVHFFFANS